MAGVKVVSVHLCWVQVTLCDLILQVMHPGLRWVSPIKRYIQPLTNSRVVLVRNFVHLFGCSSLKTGENLDVVKGIPADRLLIETGQGLLL